MNDITYLTTPIYYVNAEPHLGTAYTTILTDVLARYARLQEKQTFFSTGVDEHGQKVQQAAQAKGVAPQVFVDQIVGRFQQTWVDLSISPDCFIRTTESRHKRVVTHVLQRLWERGEIYKAAYEGWYCIPDERFWTEKDLIEGACPACGRPVEYLTESNYFFRMSAYQAWLIDYISQNPKFIRPESRRNEVLGFLRQPLGDLCISRPASRLNWGIPLPFDPDYVTYVWFDALLNYITVINYPGQDNALNPKATPDEIVNFERLWAKATHLIGKDILTTHCVYWPTMLRAIGLQPPRQILAHGWWLVEGQKMGKSLGNAVKPLDLVQLYGPDAFRYFLIRDMVFGRDGNFSTENLQRRYEGDLANDLGNLLQRLLAMIDRYCQGQIPSPSGAADAEDALRESAIALPATIFNLVDELAVHDAAATLIAFVGRINRYLEQSAPWRQAKDGAYDRVATSLYYAAEALRIVAILLEPILPKRILQLWQQLGWTPSEHRLDDLKWGILQPGIHIVRGQPLFPKS